MSFFLVRTKKQDNKKQCTTDFKSQIEARNTICSLQQGYMCVSLGSEMKGVEPRVVFYFLSYFEAWVWASWAP